jgi:hypothetical protein
MKTIASAMGASALLALSACGGSHDDRAAATTTNGIAPDPMANAMDGSALSAVGDLMNSPDAQAAIGGPAPAPRPAAPTRPAP